MFDPITRRGFVGLAAAAGALSAARVSWARQLTATTPPAPLADVFPTTDPDLARQIVGASHANIDKVRELLAMDRGLALAAWDWGFGDWETALGAASHVGNRDIAELLIANGARPDLFTLTMLGKVDAVRAVCEAMPGVQKIRGPHGITLMRHARAGKSEEMVAYLESLGGADEGEPDLGVDEAVTAAVVGVYDSSGVRFEARPSRMGGLEFLREGGAARRLSRVGAHEFTPAGAPQVTVAFIVQGDRAREVVVTRGVELVRGVRVAG